MLTDLVWKLDLPFGDPVTGPLLPARPAARAAGLSCVFNGEGGDQLFGGWTASPCRRPALCRPPTAGRRRERALSQVLSPLLWSRGRALHARNSRRPSARPAQRRAVLAPYLNSRAAATFLNRIRLADISLKGSQNILPRMDRTAQCWGLDVRAPLFDRGAGRGFVPPAAAAEAARRHREVRAEAVAAEPACRRTSSGGASTAWACRSPTGCCGPLARHPDDSARAGRRLAGAAYSGPGTSPELLQGRNVPDETAAPARRRAAVDARHAGGLAARLHRRPGPSRRAWHEMLPLRDTTASTRTARTASASPAQAVRLRAAGRAIPSPTCCSRTPSRRSPAAGASSGAWSTSITRSAGACERNTEALAAAAVAGDPLHHLDASGSASR